MGRFDPIYARLPVAAQHAAVTAYGAYWHWLRFGPGYRRHVRGYVERESWDAGRMRDWQRKELTSLLASALDVDYYQRAWTASQKKAAAAGVLEELPLLEKDPIRARPASFLISGRVPRTYMFPTSGSTGTPISTIWTADEIRKSIALREVRSLRYAGVSFALPRATFSGRMVEPDPNSSGPYYRYNAFERQVYLSPFHLSAATAPKYVAALRRWKVEWCTGYAVSYYLLARFMLDQRLEAPPLKAIITTSEKLTPEMRDVMVRAYQCRVFEEYSTVESALFASECPVGKLHVSPDAGLVEILRPDGRPCAPGEVGEVVATSLVRTHQLFIRYRLGDLACWDTTPCVCGRATPVIAEVVGRVEDVVTGPDGRQMVRFHGIFINQPNVREGQIVQEDRDRIRVCVVPSNGFSQLDADEIVARVRQRLGPGMAVTVETVDSIPRTAAGKFKAVISHV
ncbi:MAG TPA: hypothetical protein VN428_03220 [Bryobacteraceae bacterium]|nr:hypothetical protein [Bryobacteraceae bacterium]